MFAIQSPSHALTFGRFNGCTTSHIKIIELIAAQFDEITIGVIKKTGSQVLPKDTPSPIRRFYELADQQHLKTTLDLDERMKLLELSLADRGLDKKVTLKIIGRPEYEIDEFNAKFPPSTYQLVFPKPITGHGSEFDDLRDIVFPQLFNRAIYFPLTPPPFHSSEIRKKAIEDFEIWGNYMTPSAYDYFLEIDGPRRVNSRILV